MTRHIRNLAGTMVHPFLGNRCVRRAFAYRLYRKAISHSEAVVALLRKPDMLDDSHWMGKLRQYAHMVDKGLHRGDFCKGHGTWAYGMAKDALAHIKSPDRLQDPSVQWAVERIRQYEEFQAGEGGRLKADYTRTVCMYEDLVDAIKTRRSIRRYVEKPVEDAAIEKIVDVLDWAPTSCHRLPARVYATNNPDMVRQCVKAHAGAACFTDIYVPLFMMFCADTRLYTMPGELTMPSIDVALGIQNCLLVAHTLGLSLTLLSCGHRREAQELELRQMFSVPSHFEIIAGAVGGYADGGTQVPLRKDRELFIRK